jgi:hypothetical protein
MNQTPDILQSAFDRVFTGLREGREAFTHN